MASGPESLVSEKGRRWWWQAGAGVEWRFRALIPTAMRALYCRRRNGSRNGPCCCLESVVAARIRRNAQQFVAFGIQDEEQAIEETEPFLKEAAQRRFVWQAAAARGTVLEHIQRTRGRRKTGRSRGRLASQPGRSGWSPCRRAWRSERCYGEKTPPRWRRRAGCGSRRSRCPLRDPPRQSSDYILIGHELRQQRPQVALPVGPDACQRLFPQLGAPG